MKVEAHVKNSDPVPEAPYCEVTFNAKKGEAAGLKKDLDAVIEGFISYIGDMSGEDDAAAAKKMFQTEEDEDENTASITFIFPPPPPAVEAKIEKDMQGEKPKLTLSIAIARTLEQILEHKEDNFATTLGGIKVAAQTDVAKKVIMAAKLESGASGYEVMETQQFLNKLEAISSLESETTVKYRKEVLAESVGGDQAPLSALIEKVQAEYLAHIPDVVLEPLKELHQNADGLKSVVFGGLEGDEDLVLTFTEFKVSKLLNTLISTMTPPEIV